MAKLITKFRYYKPGSGRKRGGYVKYIATRERVEKIDESKQFVKVTGKQKELIKKLLEDFPDSREMPEYEDYSAAPTVKNASEFIRRCIEDNAMQILGENTYADYIATRPRAERIGSYGLFTDDGVEIVLSQVAEELNRFDGNVYTMIVSLRREDAVRLGFDRGIQWRDMLRSHTQQFAEALRIPYCDLRWYAAFHNESHHPHVHVMMWSREGNEGYLHKKGIMALRSSLANDIFRDELHNEYAEQTQVRNTLKQAWKSKVNEVFRKAYTSTASYPAIEEKLLLLARRLQNTKGKKVYGYLKKDIKDLIDSIVDALADDQHIAKLYDAWWERKCEILRTYYQNPPQKKPPLSQNKEFNSLKNDIIREALKIGESFHKNGSGNSKTNAYKQPQAKKPSDAVRQVSAASVTSLFRGLSAIFYNEIFPNEDGKRYVDRRQLQEEEEKRNAEIKVGF